MPDETKIYVDTVGQTKPKYKIVVLRYDANPEYEAQMAKFKEDGLRGNMRGSYRPDAELDLVPQKDFTARALEVMLTDEEYEKVKEAVLTTFK